ncbi:MAG: winged helix-turn-helix domain-containing protein [Tractidigestivibacter sp.]|uniref:winged helix-turn-helix domain-containing protein n=1 Tax=Tractidigestivibacter sp. TaxID=2847320 RepID=UPI003D8ABF07
MLTRPDPASARKNPSFGDLTLDVDSSRLVCGDKSCDLTQREFQMMEILMRHPNQKISVDQFMRKVWGALSDVETSVVWVNISNLRKKIASVDSSVKISAARGVGYFLEDGGEKA